MKHLHYYLDTLKHFELFHYFIDSLFQIIQISINFFSDSFLNKLQITIIFLLLVFKKKNNTLYNKSCKELKFFKK